MIDKTFNYFSANSVKIFHNDAQFGLPGSPLKGVLINIDSEGSYIFLQGYSPSHDYLKTLDGKPINPATAHQFPFGKACIKYEYDEENHMPMLIEIVFKELEAFNISEVRRSISGICSAILSACNQYRNIKGVGKVTEFAVKLTHSVNKNQSNQQIVLYISDDPTSNDLISPHSNFRAWQSLNDFLRECKFDASEP